MPGATTAGVSLSPSSYSKTGVNPSPSPWVHLGMRREILLLRKRSPKPPAHGWRRRSSVRRCWGLVLCLSWRANKPRIPLFPFPIKLQAGYGSAMVPCSWECVEPGIAGSRFQADTAGLSGCFPTTPLCSQSIIRKINMKSGNL